MEKQWKPLWNCKHSKPIVNVEMVQLIEQLTESISELSQQHNNYIYVDGEFDSNQTKFEKLSNQKKIGVCAKNDSQGYAMLRLLRIIIDKHPGCITCITDNLMYCENQPTTFGNIQTEFLKQGPYMDIIQSQPLEMKVYDMKQITKKVNKLLKSWKKMN